MGNMLTYMCRQTSTRACVKLLLSGTVVLDNEFALSQQLHPIFSSNPAPSKDIYIFWEMFMHDLFSEKIHAQYLICKSVQYNEVCYNHQELPNIVKFVKI